METKLQEKLERLKNSSAWTFDEVLEFLAGKNSTQIKELGSRVHPPVPDSRYVLMLETRQIPLSAREEYAERHAIYTKGNVEFVGKSRAEHFIKNGWAEDTESPAERKKRIKKEENRYQQAQDQFKLLQKLERAALDRDIKSVNNVDKNPITKWRLKRGSVLAWAKNNLEEVLSLRHFPSSDLIDVFGEALQDSGKPPVSAGAEKKRDDKFTRADPDGKIQEAIKKAKAKHISKNLVPYCEGVHLAIKGTVGSFSRSEDYKKQTSHALTTIQGMVRKIYNE